jgi:hypothetical protein
MIKEYKKRKKFIDDLPSKIITINKLLLILVHGLILIVVNLIK